MMLGFCRSFGFAAVDEEQPLSENEAAQRPASLRKSLREVDLQVIVTPIVLVFSIYNQ